MKPIIVVILPLGMCIDEEILSPYGYSFFVGYDNINEQWKKLESLKNTGGLIVVQPNPYSAVRKLLDPFIGEDGYIKDTGIKNVHTEEHGDFCVLLYSNPAETMAQRLFRESKEKFIGGIAYD